MSRASLLLFAGLVVTGLLLALVPSSDAADKEEPGKPVVLFNGKDLKGWKVYPEGAGEWKVEEGILIGSGPASHLFSDKGDYVNFRYRVVGMINDHGNSGQYFRTKFGPGFPKGYEAQINSTHRDPVKTGSLYGFGRIGQAMARNPIALFFPCHRVVATDGSLHNYGYGLQVKARILRMEGYKPV